MTIYTERENITRAVLVDAIDAMLREAYPDNPLEIVGTLAIAAAATIGNTDKPEQLQAHFVRLLAHLLDPET